MPAQSIVVTTCTRDCPNACGLLAKVVGGRVVSLEGDPRHPVSKGIACGKCGAFLRRMYSEERVVTPLRRVNSGWRRIAWQEALDEIAERMSEIRASHGPEAILYYRGFAQRTALRLLNERFFNLFGGVTGTRGTLCGGIGEAGQELDFGRRLSHDPLDHANTRSLVIWGRNPAVTNPSLVPVIAAVRRRGGRAVVVDPAASETVPLCDLHLQPAPGSDAFLAMAAARIILARGEEDTSFLGTCSEGFGEYLSILQRWPMEELCRRCDVPLSLVEELATLLAREKPAAILLGWGLHRWELGHQTVRCIDALGAIAGNIGIPGGGVSQGFDEYAPCDLSWTADHLHPARRRLLMPRIGREIASARDPGIRMIFVTAGNPVCQAPDSAAVATAFERTPFVVVAGHFLDDTARRAHIFLPATTFLEEEDVVASYGHNCVGPVNPAVAPAGECRSDFDLFCSLASRFPFGRDFALTAREWLPLLLKPLFDHDVTPERLREGAVRIPWAPLVPFRGGRFPTPSGKFRFLRHFDIPQERKSTSFPYHLLTVAPREWLCSELTPAEQGEPTEVRVSPAVAQRHDLAEGDRVRLVSETGSTAARLRIAPGERGDTVIFPRGRWLSSGSSANLLTGDFMSREGNGAAYHESKVRLVPEVPTAYEENMRKM